MKLAGYGRVSTDEEKQLDSLAHQQEFFALFAQAHGHELVALYADEGISGKQLKNRVQFQRMLEEARLGRFDLVVVKDVSRFARNTVDLLTSIRGLRALGVEVLFVNHNQKILGESEFVITLLGAMAQEESANLSKRVKFGKRMTAQKGRVPPLLYGYDRRDNFQLEINPREAETVRYVFSLYLDEGVGCRSIAQTLAAEGAPTKLGGSWTAKGVRRMLENPVYCGRYVNHRYTVSNFLEGTVGHLPREEHFEHLRPEWAIIPEARFQEAQRLLAQRRDQFGGGEAHGKSHLSRRHLFSTLLRCAECGSAFHRRETRSGEGIYVYWRCMTKYERAGPGCGNETILSEAELKRALGGHFAAILGDRAVAARTLLDRHGQEQQGRRYRATKTRVSEGERLEGQREKYQEMYANDLLSAEALRLKLRRIVERLAELERQPRGERGDLPKLDLEIVLEEIERFLSLETVNATELRRVVSYVAVSSGGEVEVHINFQETL